jgi:CubicO group peptidase (beta-lactamase class C family)
MTELPRSTPAEQGVDMGGIDAFVAALAPMPDVELHSLMVVRHGHVVAERWWRPYRPDAPHLLYSLSKSFASTALGFAVAEGLVQLDAPALTYFPEFDARVSDPRSRSMRVRHLASMASGHTADTIDQALLAGAGDMALGLFLLPPEQEPGSVFCYNQPCTNTLSAIIERVSGTPLTEFLRPRLFEPLGIEPYGWWTDPVGREQGYSGLHVPTEAIAKLGQVYLDGGRWHGEPLLPPEWVAEATRCHVATDRGSPDWDQGYGFQFWRSRHGYRGDGAHGQYMLILPEADAVVAITSQTPDMQGLLDQAWAHLLPALTAGSGPAGAWPAGSPSLARPVGDGTTGEIAEAVYRPGPENAVDLLRAVRIRPGRLLLDDGRGLAAALGGPDGWTVSAALATAYAWSHGELLVDVVFTESPHRLHLALAPATGTFTARWRSEPIVAMPLASMCMPRPAAAAADEEAARG